MNEDASMEERITIAKKLHLPFQMEANALKVISDNLVLNYIDVNNSHYENDDDELEFVVMLELSFNFHGEHCTGYISPEALNNEESGSYASIESPSSSNLHDSFVEVLEDEEWEAIRKECIKFLNEGEYLSDCDEHNNAENGNDE